MYNTNPDCKKLIAEGKCKADCCGIVPMEYHAFFQIKSKAYIKDFEVKKFKMKGVQFCTPIAKDFMCVFLNRETYSCEIYNSPRKPNLCRQFGMSSTETLLACRHINPELAHKIDEEANKTIEELKRKHKEKFNNETR